MAETRLVSAPTVWRFTQGPNGTKPTPADAPQCAWARLLIRHMPFHAATSEEYDRLARLRDELEQLFFETDDPSVRAYYTEAYGVAEASPPPPYTTDRTPVRHIVMLQVQLMEEVYYTLRLDRYANAPDNRGWMNLFRRWGRSPTFLRHVDAVADVLTDPFWHFFSAYVREYAQTIDDCPVPHPWDVASNVLYCNRPGVHGVFLDAGLREVTRVSGTDVDVDEGEHASPAATETPKKSVHPPESPSPGDDVTNA